MSLILTNDDGIDAPGIQALLNAVEKSQISSQVIIAAPQEHLSGCGHQITTNRPITLQRRSDTA